MIPGLPDAEPHTQLPMYRNPIDWMQWLAARYLWFGIIWDVRRYIIIRVEWARPCLYDLIHIALSLSLSIIRYIYIYICNNICTFISYYVYIYRYTWYTHAHTHKKAQKIGWRAARHLQDFPRPLGRSHRTRCSALLGDGASLHDLLRFFFWKWNIRLWINTYRYIFRGMNIHLPAILMWTTGVQGFDTLPYWEYEWYYDMVWYIDIFWHVIGKSPTDVGQWFEMLPVWRVITMKHGIRSCNPLYHYAKPPHVRVFQGSQLEFIWTWKCVCVCVRLTCVFYVIKLRVNHPQSSP